MVGTVGAGSDSGGRTGDESSRARCPCGSGEPADACCARFHRGQAEAPTAEALMRSRYSAHAVRDTAYLLRTWHPRTRPASLELDDDQRWLRLDVEQVTGGGPFDVEGTVTFAARWRSADGGRGVVRERSRFVREQRRWLYLDGA